jgi:2-polyprenyl-3-methyl-5-hydroxy-6-metoxy-1,4-benzoquinol methylase
MKIPEASLTDVDRYMANNPLVPIEEHRPGFDKYMRHLRRFRNIDATSRLLEIGVGTGWFPILCRLEGIHCKGLEISPQLVEYARRYGAQYGVEPDIETGNVESDDLGRDLYDGIIVSFVFEHVEQWRLGLRKVCEALKPGGVMYFESTNKFCPWSGEYAMPFYSWLPNATRYRLRKIVHGPDIMKLGIDFNEFTYPGLRREFRQLGFSQICDRIDLAETPHISSGFRKSLVATARSSSAIKGLVLTFADSTRFVCVK